MQNMTEIGYHNIYQHFSMSYNIHIDCKIKRNTVKWILFLSMRCGKGIIGGIFART